LLDDHDSKGWGGVAVFAMVVFAACWYFSQAGGGLAAEPPFADEAAVLAQSHYYRLVAERRFSDPDWIDHAAYDHQPLYKYAVGFALHVSGQYDGIPPTLEEFKRWINGGVRAPDVDRRLLAARWAMLAGSALAVGFVFAFVRRMRNTLIALLATAVFISSPLVFTHGRRAMIDLTAVGLAVGVLWTASRFASAMPTTKRTTLNWFAFAFLAALAPLSKWNAAATCVAAAALGVFVFAVGPGRARWIGGGLVVGVAVAVALFVALDPFYWSKPEPQELARRLQVVDPHSAAEYRKLAQASPWERGKHALEYRRGSMAAAKSMFPNDYLSPGERPFAILIEGMGRWSLGNRLYSVSEAQKPRFERREFRDWINVMFLAPLVLIGFVAAFRRGWEERRMGAFPIHWLLVVWVAVDVGLLLANLTVDWDRYYLSVVAWSSIAAAIGVHSLIRGVIGQLSLKPRELTPL
jgi:hypothetical protein